MSSYTLVFVCEPSRVLLGRKKRGMGTGYWNGFGGKVKQDEPVARAARREVLEECGLVVDDLEKRGLLLCRIARYSELVLIHVFRAKAVSGILAESDEMEPRWFPVEELPYEEMWESDRAWLPHFLGGKRFEASFSFDATNRLVSRFVAILP